jgi:uncharacterized damage-inducible protein DinB
MNPYVLSIRHTPAILVRMLDQISPERYTDVLQADRFNLVEVIAHIADWEDIFLDRLRQTVEHPGSTLQAIDEGARAIEKKYETKEPHHELEVFANRRRDTVSFLEQLPAGQWGLSAIHSERGPVTVSDQATFLLGHDLYHIEQVTEYFTVLHALVP